MVSLVPEWNVDNVVRIMRPFGVPPAVAQRMLMVAEFLRRHVPLEVIETTNLADDKMPDGGSNSIWLRDYHALSAFEKPNSGIKYVAFEYQPAYLEESARGATTFDRRQLCSEYIHVPLRIDGGNLIYNGRGDIIMTERVLTDNLTTHEALLATLRETIDVRSLTLLPEEPGDMTGHIDGSVRFIDQTTVAAVTYPTPTAQFQRYALELTERLSPHFHIVNVLSEDPLDIYGESMPSAYGNRLGWIRWQNKVLFPAFGMDYDTELPGILAKYGLNAIAVPAHTFELLSHFGGSLHCLTADFTPQEAWASRKETGSSQKTF